MNIGTDLSLMGGERDVGWLLDIQSECSDNHYVPDSKQTHSFSCRY